MEVRQKFCIVGLLLLMSGLQTALGQNPGIIHVPANQPTIQAGINAAASGDTVLVADGLYLENINYNGKAITVASYFLINGDTAHISNTIINGNLPGHPDSGSVVLFNSGEDTTSVLSGFTITGGSGTIDNDNNRRGGGINLEYAGARISNNKITGNSIIYNNFRPFGGGVSCISLEADRKFVIFEGNTITHNRVLSTYMFGGYGGGIFLEYTDALIQCNVISFNEVSGGTACYGPGFGIRYATNRTRIVDNTISANTFSSGNSNGGGVLLIITNGVSIRGNTIDGNFGTLGGGIYDWRSSNNLFSNNYINNNTADFGGGIYVQETTNNTITDNRITNNMGTRGGGIGVQETLNNTIANNRIAGNISTSGGGGGIRLSRTTGTMIINNNVIGNSTNSGAGGGVYDFESTGSSIGGNKLIDNFSGVGGGAIATIASNTPIYNNLIALNRGSLGGGIAVINSNPESQIINNTITGNTGALGGGLYNETSNSVVMNTILWGDSAIAGDEIEIDGGAVKVHYSNIDGGWSGTGNINIDPQFIDSLYHLSKNSLCINGGVDSLEIDGNWYFSPTTDLEGNPRPYMGTAPDLGAYESQTPGGLTPLSEHFPESYRLFQNYPNPFNPGTTVEFALLNSGRVTLKIYNILGEEVAELVAEHLVAGSYRYNWNAAGLASGVYYYRLTSDDFSQTLKMLLVR